jgi:hypothetical protein
MFIPNEQGSEDTIPPAYLFIFFVDEIGGTSDGGVFSNCKIKEFSIRLILPQMQNREIIRKR